MTKQEYHALLTFITDAKTKNEMEDAALEQKINDCQDQLKNEGDEAVQTDVDRFKDRRFDGLKQEREELCEGFIKEKTGFTGDILPIYTDAERQDLKGERWARFMLNKCGCLEPM